MNEEPKVKSKSRGRPLGFKLSEESKKAISDAKKGQRHSEVTKDKISQTLLTYFRNMHPLSEELFYDYKDLIETSSEVGAWYESIKLIYDESMDIYTEKSLNSRRYREVSIEYNINMEDNPHTKLASDPEVLLDLKRECAQVGLNFREVCHHLGVKLNG